MFPAAVLFDLGHRSIGVEVAASGAVAQFIHAVEHRLRFFVFLVRALSEITCMAARAIRAVGRCGPGRRDGVAAVAVSAGQPRGMPRWEGARGVAIGDAGPPSSAMALVALKRGLEMPVRFASGRHTIMAGRTAAGDRGVIELDIGPAGGDVAIAADVGSRNMRRRFAGGGRAVVTGLASTGH